MRHLCCRPCPRALACSSMLAHCCCLCLRAHGSSQDTLHIVCANVAVARYSHLKHLYRVHSAIEKVLHLQSFHAFSREQETVCHVLYECLRQHSTPGLRTSAGLNLGCRYLSFQERAAHRKSGQMMGGGPLPTPPRKSKGPKALALRFFLRPLLFL